MTKHSAKKPPNKKDVGRAFRLTRRIELGKKVEPADLAWLANYKRSVGKPMPTVKVASSPWAAGDNAPQPPTSQPTPEAELPPDSPPTIPDVDQGGAEKPSETPPPPPKAEPTPELLATAGALAAQLCALLCAVNEDLAADGYMVLSPQMIGTFVEPAATRLALKALPKDVQSDDADAAIVGGAVAITGVQWYRQYRKRTQRSAESGTPMPRQETPAATPPPAKRETPTSAPMVKDRPASNPPATSPGTLTEWA